MQVTADEVLAPELERLASISDPPPTPVRHSARSVERLVGVALLFAGWELASRVGWLDEGTLGAPSTMATVGWDMIRDGSLGGALAASARRVASALGLGVAVGAALALVAGLSRAGDAAVDANMQMLRYVPVLAVQPLLIMWFGIGETAKVVLIALGVIFPVYINTASAVRAIRGRYHEIADVLGLTAWQRLRRVVIPGALGGFLVGLRYAAAVAWLLVIVAEQTNADQGIGPIMVRAQAFMNTDVIVVCVVTYASVGVACDLAIRRLERWATRWEPRR